MVVNIRFDPFNRAWIIAGDPEWRYSADKWTLEGVMREQKRIRRGEHVYFYLDDDEGQADEIQ